MKFFFIGATTATIYLIRVQKPYCLTYDREGDSFPHWLTLLPLAAVLTLFLHQKIEDPQEDSAYIALHWAVSYSWWLEALAFIP